MLRSFFIAIHWIHLNSCYFFFKRDVKHNTLAKGKIPSCNGIVPILYIPDYLNWAVFPMKQWELRSIWVSDAFPCFWSGRFHLLSTKSFPCHQMHYFPLIYFNNCIKANTYVTLLFIFCSKHQVMSFFHQEAWICFLITFNEMPIGIKFSICHLCFLMYNFN